MSTTVPLMRVSAVCELIRWLTDHGRSIEPLLAASDLGSFNVSDPDGIVPLLPVSKFCTLVMRQEGLDIGARIVTASTMSRIGGLGQVLLRGPTVQHSLINLAIGFSRQATHAHLTVTPSSDELVIRHFYSIPLNDEFTHFSQQFSAALVKALLVSAHASDPVFEKVSMLPHPRHGLDHLLPYFGPALRPSTSTGLTLVLRKAVAALHVQGMAGEKANDLLDEKWRSLREGATLSHTVRFILQELLRDGEPRIGQVARISGLSTRTLQRRLSQENVSYAELLDQVRKDIVLRMLETGDHLVGDSAQLASYSSSSSITRAVRRWTGDTPRSLLKKPQDHGDKSR